MGGIGREQLVTTQAGEGDRDLRSREARNEVRLEQGLARLVVRRKKVR